MELYAKTVFRDQFFFKSQIQIAEHPAPGACTAR
jgi:hypothetical protein